MGQNQFVAGRWPNPAGFSVPGSKPKASLGKIRKEEKQRKSPRVAKLEERPFMSITCHYTVDRADLLTSSVIPFNFAVSAIYRIILS